MSLRVGHEFFLRDVQAIRRHIARAERQLAFYERNGWGDELRFALVRIELHWALEAAKRADRRAAASRRRTGER